MLLQQSPSAVAQIDVRVHQPPDLAKHLERLQAYAGRAAPGSLGHRQLDWLLVLRQGLGHTPYCLEVVREGKTRGLLGLAYVKSLLFGRFLVSLPYVNYGGVLADDDEAAGRLIERAVQLADELGVRFLELRQERAISHPALTTRANGKVHMRRPLPGSPEELWKQLDGKVRNQVRKGQKSGLTVTWGGVDLLSEFYAVFSHNMRDLGTPVYPRRLFQAVLEQFPGQAELCVVRTGGAAAAAALVLHGRGVTEVPSASSLRQYNKTCANMLMYWHLLERAVQRKQAVFDFGRSTPGSGTYGFKEQWGAAASPAEWQYYMRRGTVTDMRPDNPRYQRLIRLWQRLPVWLTRLIGPAIVRGIP
jgi:FemAB-related protein (PEP-CTERM system-associated)